VVEKVLGNVVRRIDANNSPFESGERKGLGAGRGPFIKWPD
jgi:hypothetical protein